MRLGIMGGTFDPIHHGHLFIAEEARVHFRLEHVLFIPNGTPPHKKDYALTPAHHRLEMTRLATAPNAAFGCSPLEVERPGPSYAVDTLHQLQVQYPNAELFYITGVDAVAEILSWRRHTEVIQLATFIAATRPGIDRTTLEHRLPPAYRERILLLDSTDLAISSTEIRDRIRRGLPIRYLTTDGVVEYIDRYHLYK